MGGKIKIPVVEILHFTNIRFNIKKKEKEFKKEDKKNIL